MGADVSAIITNFHVLKGLGVLADRTAQSPDLHLRRYNLIYGFNGSGKSTIARLLASLARGTVDPGLPDGCSFQVTLSDGSGPGATSNPNGLERRLLVFNVDYIDRNLQWRAGLASPVFFVGADQADAAASLATTEGRIAELNRRQEAAEAAAKAAETRFRLFKRERAKLTASRLHLGSRKYEAPALTRDYESWKEEAGLLTDSALMAAEDIRRRDAPLPRLDPLAFDATSVTSAVRFVTSLCGQSVAVTALTEIERFPEMLLWLKAGHSFHADHALGQCLFCGGPLSPDRMARLTAALDSHVDAFIARLDKTAERLQGVMNDLAATLEAIPTSQALVADLRPEFDENRALIASEARRARATLATLQGVLSRKRERPASPADLSQVPAPADVEANVQALATVLAGANRAIAGHNAVVEDFAKHRNEAEITIRKHFVAECRDDFADFEEELDKAQASLAELSHQLGDLSAEADRLRQQVKAHGPAAEKINRLVASYLGHGELTIHPIDQGYELHRHGKPIKGAPSEGEKTAIAIAYFLSSLEAEGRRLRDLIVVVDDPVSSLDTKALNFACALVRGRLEHAAQVFVLTHNLQCMNEFRKAWKGRIRPKDDKEPTATFLFLDVCKPPTQDRRVARLVEMPRLLREYDSEYHFLFSRVLSFASDSAAYADHDYMMPNVLRRVLDVFLAFKCPGSDGLVGKIDKLCADHPGLDRVRLAALERLAQVESHSDSLDDLLSLSSMTIEETRQAAAALMEMIERVDPKHLAALRRLCRPAA